MQSRSVHGCISLQISCFTYYTAACTDLLHCIMTMVTPPGHKFCKTYWRQLFLWYESLCSSSGIKTMENSVGVSKSPLHTLRILYAHYMHILSEVVHLRTHMKVYNCCLKIKCWICLWPWHLCQGGLKGTLDWRGLVHVFTYSHLAVRTTCNDLEHCNGRTIYIHHWI